jgi:hypothetical protein
MEDGLMEGSITARPLDYFALLVRASIVALFSCVVATLCGKFEERGLGGSGQHPSLVLQWSVRTAWGSCCEVRHE